MADIPSSAIGYVRVSTEEQASEGVSLDAQRAKVLAYCGLHGLELAQTYADEGLSGKRADNRPGLQQAITHTCESHSVLIVYSLSRLARSTRDAIDIAERLAFAPSHSIQSPDSFLKEGSMVINVRTHGFSLSDALRQHVENCLAAATRPFGRAVSSVTARLTDINAGRGGNDKQCRLVAMLPHRRPIVTEALHTDAYISIEQSSSRMRRAISHALGRHARRRRRPIIRFDAVEVPDSLMSG